MLIHTAWTNGWILQSENLKLSILNETARKAYVIIDIAV